MIVEDDPVIEKTIKQFLQARDYIVVLAAHLTAVDRDFKYNQPDLVIMDLILPYYSGFHWLELIRKNSQVPVIFLTSAGDDPNLITAMNLGADDFLGKPIDLSVLLAKVQGVMRRVYKYQVAQTQIQRGNYLLDISDHQIRYEQKLINLTPIETKLLSLLFEHPNALITRHEMINHLWESDDYIDQNALSVAINRLRRKIAPIGLAEKLVTIKGSGYRLFLEEIHG